MLRNEVPALSGGGRQSLQPAVVLSGSIPGLGVIRALGRMGVPIVCVYYDHRDMGYVSRYVTRRVTAPNPSTHAEEFIELLIDLAGEYAGSFLVPTSDATVVLTSMHKALLEQYYRVGAVDWAIAQKFIDKQLTYALAEKEGVPAPRTILARSLADVTAFGQSTSYPCLVKPSVSHDFYARFGQKMYRAEGLDQLMEAYAHVAGSGLDVLLQEFVPGPDSMGANYNAYFWDGEPLVEFTARKVRNGPPATGSPRVAFSETIIGVVESGRAILRGIGYYGYACVEFKKDVDTGVYKLMEINGRHNLSSLLAVRAGINFPWLHYRHLMLGELPEQPAYREGIYWTDFTRDVGYSIQAYRYERYPLGQYLAPYLRPHVDAIADRRDPKPFLKRSFDLIRRLLSGIMRRRRPRKVQGEDRDDRRAPTSSLP